MKEQLQYMELCMGMEERLTEKLCVTIKKKGDKNDSIVGHLTMKNKWMRPSTGR